nr:MAG TPA: hypothetical protein [Caudoviricetes sp.]
MSALTDLSDWQQCWSVFRLKNQAKEGQKGGMSSKLLYFYDKKQMCFVAHKGLFYRVLSHFTLFSLVLSISVQYVNLFHSMQKPIDPFYRFIFCSRIFN